MKEGTFLERHGRYKRDIHQTLYAKSYNVEDDNTVDEIIIRLDIAEEKSSDLKT